MYCKLKQQQEREKQEAGINSSKVYCKSKMSDNVYSFSVVLIVAKCIVNLKVTSITVETGKY